MLVHVDFAPDYADAPVNVVDQPSPRPPGGMGPDFAEFAEGLPVAGLRMTGMVAPFLHPGGLLEEGDDGVEVAVGPPGGAAAVLDVAAQALG